MVNWRKDGLDSEMIRENGKFPSIHICNSRYIELQICNESIIQLIFWHYLSFRKRLSERFFSAQHGSGMVGTANKGAADHPGKPHFQRFFPVRIEMRRPDVSFDRKMGLRWLQVLTDGQQGAAMGAEIGNGVEEFRILFSETDHDAALDEYLLRMAGCLFQKLE